MISPASRAYRILKPMSSYVDAIEDPGWIDKLPSQPEIGADEVILGVYTNSVSTLDEAIVFTTLALYLFVSDGWRELKYSDIYQVISPKDKELVSGVEIVRNGKENFWLPVRGVKDGKFYDAYEVVRFLLRVMPSK